MRKLTGLTNALPKFKNYSNGIPIIFETKKPSTKNWSLSIFEMKTFIFAFFHLKICKASSTFRRATSIKREMKLLSPHRTHSSHNKPHAALRTSRSFSSEVAVVVVVPAAVVVVAVAAFLRMTSGRMIVV